MADYKTISKEVRRDVLSLIHKGQTSHVASCFSLADVATVLYENLKENDVVIWSKGWASALHYVLEIRRGNLNREDVFAKFPNEPYLALLETCCPTVITAGGSVGHGLSVAVGMALARKREGKEGNVYCLMSDGELNEGAVWEAAMFAKQHKLNNLIAIIDKNNWQAMGKTEDVLNLEPLEEAWTGFGWKVARIDGHDCDQIEASLTVDFDFHMPFNNRQGWSADVLTDSNFVADVKDKPLVIIADTIKGKGVSFMENHLLYHYKHVDDETYKFAMQELND